MPYLSWTDIATLDNKANTVIVLPTGAIEQHGPHLPCAVDSVISQAWSGMLWPAYRLKFRPMLFPCYLR
ncbi:creatininase family protein [Pantoea sp. LMR881]|uniref:creatininase family protein n=1 Tax=Pantoea sp. LMR881 TaxID=3014336 RepID=UPI003FA74C44